MSGKTLVYLLQIVLLVSFAFIASVQAESVNVDPSVELNRSLRPGFFSDRLSPVEPVEGTASLVLRLYAGWPENNAKYREIKAILQNDLFTIPQWQLSGSVLVALVPWDQKNPKALAYLGNDLITWQATGGVRRSIFQKKPRDPIPFALPGSRLRVAEPSSLPILDALGNPMPRCTVELVLSEDGHDHSPHLIISYKGRGTREEVPGIIPWGKLAKCRIRVSHPLYGIASPVDPGAQMPLHRGFPEQFLLPFVSRKSPEFDRALHVTVQSPDEQPVRDAPVVWGGYYGDDGPFLGGGTKSLIDYREPRIWTDRKGRFSLYPPLANIRSTGKDRLLLRGTVFQFRVAPPPESRLVPKRFTAQTGSQKHMVHLTRGDKAYRIIVLDAQGQEVKDQQQLYRISLHFSSPGTTETSDLHIYEFEQGLVLPQGTLKAAGYAAIETGPDAPSTLMLRPIAAEEVPSGDSKHRSGWVVCGRVLDGVTSNAISSAVVVTQTHWRGSNAFGDLNQDDWDRLDSIQEAVGINDPRLECLRESIGFDDVQVSDQHGLFWFQVSPLKIPYSVVVVKNGYIPVAIRIIVPKESLGMPDMRLDLPLISLLPAATVGFTLQTPGTTPMLSIIWKIEREGNPPWASKYENALFLPYQILLYGQYPTANQPQKILVPAGLRLRLFAITSYRPEWGNLKLADALMVEKGHMLNLGTFDVKPALTAKVIVLDPEGHPMEGVPVSIYEEGYRYSRKAVPSGVDGKAEVYITPNTKGFIMIQPRMLGLDSPSPQMVETYEVGAAIPDDHLFEVRLSKEMIERLFPEE